MSILGPTDLPTPSHDQRYTKASKVLYPPTGNNPGYKDWDARHERLTPHGNSDFCVTPHFAPRACRAADAGYVRSRAAGAELDRARGAGPVCATSFSWEESTHIGWGAS